MSEQPVPDPKVQALGDALSDDWPDTPSGWATFEDKYQLAGDIAEVIASNADVRDAVLAVMAETRDDEPLPDHDNHHNAAVCPHCTHNGEFVMVKAAERDALQAEVERLKTAILDIDAHAVPRSTDEHGFNASGYVISIGSLHRALGLIGHAAAECSPEYPCGNCSERAVLVGIIRHLRDDLIPCSSHDEGWRWYMPDYDGNCVVAGSEPMTPAEAEFFTQEGENTKEPRT